jgi:competence protein ComEC
VIVGLALATLSVWEGAVGRESEPTLDAVFFDVGQGGATLLAMPNDRHVLVDAGPRSPTGSAAEFVVLPYLERWGIRTLDAVVVTHPDEDHLGGVPALLREVSVGQVVDNGWSADTELYEEFERLCTQLEVPRDTVERGDRLSLGSDVRTQVLSPLGREETRVGTRNNASIVLRVDYGNVSILLPGDIEREMESFLVHAYGDQLESEVVKIPHHGSSTSSSSGFVEAVSGEEGDVHAVVSVGGGDQYDMPDEQTLSRWTARGAVVHSTANRGAVWMRTDGTDVWPVDWK